MTITADAWMQIPARSLSLREENIIGNIEQAMFEAHTPARKVAEAALNKAKADHQGETSPAAQKAIRDAEDTLNDAEAAETADVQRIIWITALRVAYRSGILAYAGALVADNPFRATAALVQNMMQSSETTDQAMAAEVENLLTDGPGILAILGNKYPGMDPLFRK